MRHTIKTPQEAEIELAKSKLNLILNQGKNPYDLIDKIYQDFYNRTCENCRYCQEGAYGCHIFIECKNPKSRMFCESLLDITYPNIIDFGCNKWETKNEKS